MVQMNDIIVVYKQQKIGCHKINKLYPHYIAIENTTWNLSPHVKNTANCAKMS